MVKLIHGGGHIVSVGVEDINGYAATAIALSQAIFALYGDDIRPRLTPRLMLETSGQYGVGYLISGLGSVGYTLGHDKFFKKFTLTGGIKS